MSEEAAQRLFLVQQGCGPGMGRAGAVDREGGTRDVGTLLSRGERELGRVGHTFRAFCNSVMAVLGLAFVANLQLGGVTLWGGRS